MTGQLRPRPDACFHVPRGTTRCRRPLKPAAPRPSNEVSPTRSQRGVRHLVMRPFVLGVPRGASALTRIRGRYRSPPTERLQARCPKADVRRLVIPRNASSATRRAERRPKQTRCFTWNADSLSNGPRKCHRDNKGPGISLEDVAENSAPPGDPRDGHVASKQQVERTTARRDLQRFSERARGPLWETWGKQRASGLI